MTTKPTSTSNNSFATSSSIRLGATWTSPWIFLLAAVSSSIGLGNIWKFPYELGQHGGGTFLLVYLICVVTVSLPVIMAEIMVGRYGGSNPIHGVMRIIRRERLSSLWQSIGWLSIVAGFLVFSFYSVVASWILFYIMQSATGSFVGVPAEMVQHSFGALLRNIEQQLIWYTVFVLAVILILTRGLRRGLERALLVFMPCFFLLLIWLCVLAAQVGNFEYAREFLFSVNLADINGELFVSALTQALFSASIGLGAMLMYGAYLGEGRPIAGSALMVVLFDTLVAILMSLLIFSIVFAFGLRPDAGFALIFETLPVAFSQISENSVLWSTAFFTLTGIAAMASAFALLEPVIAWITRRFNLSRRAAAWLVGAFAWLAGLPSLLSFGDARFSFYYFDKEYSNGIFDLLNITTTHLLLPTIALMIAVFSAWRISAAQSETIFSSSFSQVFKIWQWFTRFIAPALLGLALILVLLIPSSL